MGWIEEVPERGRGLKHLRALVVVLLVTVALLSCGNGHDGPVGRAQADIANLPPYGPGVEVGETYDYVLYTHCGIEWARIDGVWWRSTPRDDGNANPPPGWGNPYDGGRLSIVEEDTATYNGGLEVDVKFNRTKLAEPPFLCM